MRYEIIIECVFAEVMDVKWNGKPFRYIFNAWLIWFNSCLSRRANLTEFPNSSSRMKSKKITLGNLIANHASFINAGVLLCFCLSSQSLFPLEIQMDAPNWFSEIMGHSNVVHKCDHGHFWWFLYSSLETRDPWAFTKIGRVSGGGEGGGGERGSQ